MESYVLIASSRVWHKVGISELNFKNLKLLVKVSDCWWEEGLPVQQLHL